MDPKNMIIEQGIEHSWYGVSMVRPIIGVWIQGTYKILLNNPFSSHPYLVEGKLPFRISARVTNLHLEYMYSMYQAICPSLSLACAQILIQEYRINSP
jgi:hypothetical protein